MMANFWTMGDFLIMGDFWIMGDLWIMVGTSVSGQSYYPGGVCYQYDQISDASPFYGSCNHHGYTGESLPKITIPCAATHVPVVQPPADVSGYNLISQFTLTCTTQADKETRLLTFETQLRPYTIKDAVVCSRGGIITRPSMIWHTSWDVELVPSLITTSSASPAWQEPRGSKEWDAYPSEGMPWTPTFRFLVSTWLCTKCIKRIVCLSPDLKIKFTANVRAGACRLWPSSGK